MTEQTSPHQLALLVRIRTGDSSVFDELVQPCLERLRRIAQKYLNQSPELQEDVVQETLGKAFLEASKLRENSVICAWVGKICVNSCLDLLRKKKRLNEVSSNDIVEQNEDGATREEFIEDKKLPVEDSVTNTLTLQSIINILPLRTKEIFIMFHKHGLEVKDISNSMGITGAVVYARLERAHKFIKKSLEELGLTKKALEYIDFDLLY